MSAFYPPMLAQEYSVSREKVAVSTDSWLLQPKLDGFRCVTVIEITAGMAKMPWTHWSRHKNELESSPAIASAVEKVAVEFQRRNGILNGHLVLDGELYIHGSPFQETASIIRNHSRDRGRNRLKYHVYDGYVPEETDGYGWEDRTRSIYGSIAAVKSDVIVSVETSVIDLSKETKVDHYLEKYSAAGYEGIMLRNAAEPYKIGKRSSGLLKYKKFLDKEFRVVSVFPGKGKNEVAAQLEVVDPNDSRVKFVVVSPGTYEEKALVLQNPKKYIGKLITIKYQEVSMSGIPRFPEALRWRLEDRGY